MLTSVLGKCRECGIQPFLSSLRTKPSLFQKPLQLQTSEWAPRKGHQALTLGNNCLSTFQHPRVHNLLDMLTLVIQKQTSPGSATKYQKVCNPKQMQTVDQTEFCRWTMPIKAVKNLGNFIFRNVWKWCDKAPEASPLNYTERQGDRM